MKYIVLAFVFITFGSKVVSQTNVALNQTYDAVSDTANVGYVFDGLNDSNYWAALTLQAGFLLFLTSLQRSIV